MAAEGALAHLLSAADRALVDAAVDAVQHRYRYGRHTVGAAVRGETGRIYAAVNLDATVGRAAVCAEAVALGAAIMGGESTIEAVVAVRHPRPDEQGPIAVVSPCGLCRELLFDHAPGCHVILPERGRVPIASLLPAPYRR